MSRLPRLLSTYAAHVSRLAESGTTTELSYYPALHALLEGLVQELGLRFDVRTSTSERRRGGGVDLPDLALYDGDGDFVVVCGEVKLPTADLQEMARSTDRNDQVGRYLARTRVVLLSNVRGFALVVTDPAWQGPGPVPADHRRLEQTLELWPSVSSLRTGRIPDGSIGRELLDLVEAALTRFAPIAEPETLARVLARQGRRAKAALPAQFGQAVQRLADDFGAALGITFESEEGVEFFRSSLVQTVFYGLFAGWLLYSRQPRTLEFRWQDLNEYLGIPFLGGLFHEIENPTRLRELGLRPYLDQATATLARVHRESFFARLAGGRGPNGGHGEQARTASAIVYFYEPFLETFDPELRKQLGVWYTPPDIVRYQVQKIDRLLRDELGCPLGFADDRVVVLDPCCGTGAYLLEVLACMAGALRAEGVDAELGATLRDAMHRRVLGFELLTAPFVVSHLQLYLLLADMGLSVDAADRPAVYLTNALTGWREVPQLNLAFPELEEEREAAQRIKAEAPIIVMLGNPPYNRFAGAPIAEERELIDPYKGIRRDQEGRQVGQTELFTRWGVRKQLLDDLYIRFFRLAEERIGRRAAYGIVSFISNSSFLTGRSHPIMRESLLAAFDEVWIDDLHGNRLASERTPWGDSCETIFSTDAGAAGIKVGTTITTWVKRAGHVATPERCRVHRRNFWGRAEAKREALLSSLGMDGWTADALAQAENRPEGPRQYETIIPECDGGWKLAPSEGGQGYEEWPALDEIFPLTVQGVNPNRGLDGSVIDQDRAALAERMRSYFSAQSDERIEAAYPELMRDRARYNPRAMRAELRAAASYEDDKVARYLLFPLDSRFIYYETEAKLLNERRPELGELVDDNEFLVVVPQARRPSEALPLMSSTFYDLHLHDRGSVGFPAERLVEVETALLAMGQPGRQRAPNLTAPVSRVLGARYGWDSRAGSSMRALFRAIMAIMHAPSFLDDHAEALAQDWARVPLPRDPELFRALTVAGDRVMRLLDPWCDARVLTRQILGDQVRYLAKVTRQGGGAVSERDLRVTVAHYGSARGGWRPRQSAAEVGTVEAWGEGTGDLYLNEQVYLRHVPPAVWRFELGGYPVIKKWLGYREARRRGDAPLTLPEKEHLRSMVHRIAALLALRPELDELYSRAAGDAFTVAELGLEAAAI